MIILCVKHVPDIDCQVTTVIDQLCLIHFFVFLLILSIVYHLWSNKDVYIQSTPAPANLKIFIHFITGSQHYINDRTKKKQKNLINLTNKQQIIVTHIFQNQNGRLYQNNY